MEFTFIAALLVLVHSPVFGKPLDAKSADILAETASEETNEAEHLPESSTFMPEVRLYDDYSNPLYDDTKDNYGDGYFYHGDHYYDEGNDATSENSTHHTGSMDPSDKLYTDRDYLTHKDNEGKKEDGGDSTDDSFYDYDYDYEDNLNMDYNNKHDYSHVAPDYFGSHDDLGTKTNRNNVSTTSDSELFVGKRELEEGDIEEIPQQQSRHGDADDDMSSESQRHVGQNDNDIISGAHNTQSPNTQPDIAADTDLSPNTQPDIAADTDLSPNTQTDIAADTDLSPNTQTDIAADTDLSPNTQTDIAADTDLSAHTQPDIAAETDLSAHTQPDIAADTDLSPNTQPDIAADTRLSSDTVAGNDHSVHVMDIFPDAQGHADQSDADTDITGNSNHDVPGGGSLTDFDIPNAGDIWRENSTVNHENNGGNEPHVVVVDGIIPQNPDTHVIQPPDLTFTTDETDSETTTTTSTTDDGEEPRRPSSPISPTSTTRTSQSVTDVSPPQITPSRGNLPNLSSTKSVTDEETLFSTSIDVQTVTNLYPGRTSTYISNTERSTSFHRPQQSTAIVESSTNSTTSSQLTTTLTSTLATASLDTSSTPLSSTNSTKKSDSDEECVNTTVPTGSDSDTTSTEELSQSTSSHRPCTTKSEFETSLETSPPVVTDDAGTSGTDRASSGVITSNTVRPTSMARLTTPVRPVTTEQLGLFTWSTTVKSPDDSEMTTEMSHHTVTDTDSHVDPVIAPDLSTTTTTKGDHEQQTTPSGVTESPNPETTTTVRAVTTRPPFFVELTFQMSWPEFCFSQTNIRTELLDIIRTQDEDDNVTGDQIQVIDSQSRCLITSDVESPIAVQMYMTNKSHHYDRRLTVKCAHLIKTVNNLKEDSIIRTKLIYVEFRGTENGTEDIGTTIKDHGRPAQSRQRSLMDDPGIKVALVLGVISGCCFAGIITLMIISRRRIKASANLGSSLNRSLSITSGEDSIQLSSVSKSSLHNSTGVINMGLDLMDPPDPTHPLNVIQLANFTLNEKKIFSEFQKIPNRLPRLSVVPDGEEDKNRYANVLPLANTRVKLLSEGPEPRSSYINANYLTGPDNECQYYIATQAPTEDTTADFWTMVWQQGSKAIVMLTQMVEDGQSRCPPYFPELKGKIAASKFGDYLVELKHKEVTPEYIVSKLELHNLRKIEHREIVHYWFTCWPAKGLPEPISLVKLVLDTRPVYETGSVPLVVHCSPGTGRTCTFIALDLCMRQFEKRRIVDVMKTVNVMRHERAGAIQNKEQYALIYQAINEYASILVSPTMSATSSATTLHQLLPS